MKRADERKKELMKSLVEGAIMGLAFFVMFGSMLYRKEISAILNVVLDPLASLAMAEDYLRKRLNPQDCAFYQTWN